MAKYLIDKKLILDQIRYVSQSINDPRFMNDVGKLARDVIRKRTRLGYGVEKEGGKKEKLEKLSKPYIKQRKKYLKLSSGASATKSNLTQTGHMLRSMIWRITRSSIIVQFSNPFAKDKAGWAHDGAKKRPPRPFMFLSKLEIKQVQNKVSKYFKTILKIAFK